MKFRNKKKLKQMNDITTLSIGNLYLGGGGGGGEDNTREGYAPNLL